jgi:esterase/lipase superfamily enzyme
MRRVFICLLLYGSLLLGNADLWSASPSLAGYSATEQATLTQQVAELRRSGNTAEALVSARRLLEVAAEAEGRDSIAVARALVIVAELYAEIGNRTEAEPLYRRAVAILTNAGAEATEIAAVQEQLAALETVQAAGRPKTGRRMRRGPALREQQEPPEQRTLPQPAAPAESTEWDVVPVFYGTDRAETPSEGRVSYGSDRGRRLDLGRALVTVPKLHQVPNIERPWALHIPYFDVVVYQEAEDPKQHFTLKEVKRLPRDEFLSLVRERLLASSRFRDHALVFVHGFNTSFDNALYRTAQIAYDLQFDGAPFLYSWPSGGNLGSYTYDRESAEGAEPHLRSFLDTVIKETGAKSVSVIAHSMGNQALLNVLRDLNSPPPGVLISQIILAAPDVGADNFVNLAQRIAGLSGGTTLYAASNDRALLASRNFWRGPRAGEIPVGGPVIVQGIDTIDVTGASTDIFALNHSGYAQNIELLTDVGRLIEQGVRPPSDRFDKLKAVTSANGSYWRYVSGDDVNTGTPR